MKADEIIDVISALQQETLKFQLNEKVEILNSIRRKMSKVSPFSDQVDTIHWVKIETVEANNYNPNRVAPPGMKLLEMSIREDGFTQPIVLL